MHEKGYIVEETKPLNVLNVYSDKLQMCIEQEMIEEKYGGLLKFWIIRKQTVEIFKILRNFDTSTISKVRDKSMDKDIRKNFFMSLSLKFCFCSKLYFI